MKKETITEIGAAAGGAGAGAAIGSSLGVVGIFGGVAATWPLALIACAGGYGFVKIKNLRRENARLKALIAQELKDAAPR